MATSSIRVKRNIDGAAGPPSTLAGGEMAYDEVGGILYIGVGVAADGRTATQIVPIGGVNFNTVTTGPGGTGGTEILEGGQEVLLGGQLLTI